MDQRSHRGLYKCSWISLSLDQSLKIPISWWLNIYTGTRHLGFVLIQGKMSYNFRWASQLLHYCTHLQEDKIFPPSSRFWIFFLCLTLNKVLAFSISKFITISWMNEVQFTNCISSPNPHTEWVNYSYYEREQSCCAFKQIVVTPATLLRAT